MDKTIWNSYKLNEFSSKNKTSNTTLLLCLMMILPVNTQSFRILLSVLLFYIYCLLLSRSMNYIFTLYLSDTICGWIKTHMLSETFFFHSEFARVDVCTYDFDTIVMNNVYVFVPITLYIKFSFRPWDGHRGRSYDVYRLRHLFLETSATLLIGNRRKMAIKRKFILTLLSATFFSFVQIILWIYQSLNESNINKFESDMNLFWLDLYYR